jgi:ribosomal protein S8
MLNNLKNAIRKKKIYFTVSLTRENIQVARNFLAYNLINGFSTLYKYNKKKTFLVVFVNYCYNFDASIKAFSVTSKKTYSQKNAFDTKYLNSNFVTNVDLQKKVASNSALSESKKVNSCIKFR